MANRDGLAFGNFVIVKNGANYDFVVTDVIPVIDNPGAANEVDKAAKDPGFFDFSKVTAGAAYDEVIEIESGKAGEPDKHHVKGRKLGDAVTVGQINTAVTNEVKSQGNAS